MNPKIETSEGDYCHRPWPMAPMARVIKRTIDLVVAISLLALVGWLIPLLAGIAMLATGESGLFCQQRVGRHGCPFKIIKVRTMRSSITPGTSVTTVNDERIYPAGRWMRRLKLDELPQLWNVAIGHMSLVGPRPDVPGFADHLTGHDRVVLDARPGITSPASVVFRHEERVLAEQSDPETYNRCVLWPAKVRLNSWYVEHWSLMLDLRCLIATAIPAEQLVPGKWSKIAAGSVGR